MSHRDEWTDKRFAVLKAELMRTPAYANGAPKWRERIAALCARKQAEYEYDYGAHGDREPSKQPLSAFLAADAAESHDGHLAQLRIASGRGAFQVRNLERIGAALRILGDEHRNVCSGLKAFYAEVTELLDGGELTPERIEEIAALK